MAATRELGERIKELGVELAAVEARLHDLLLNIPNLVFDDVPDGGEDESVVLREVGERTSFAFEPRRPPRPGRSARLDRHGAGSQGQRLALCLPQGRPRAARARPAAATPSASSTAHGYRPVLPPVLVREEAMYGTGFFPADEQQIYRTTDGDCLVGTAEVPWRRCTWTSSSKPRRCRCATPATRPAFAARPAPPARTRAASCACTSSTSSRCSLLPARAGHDEHELIRETEEEIFGGLGIPYRVVNIAAGDLGAPAAKKYDLEAWMPGQQRYREITSCSNCTDYQARRLNCRYRTDKGPRFVYTLNGTAVAMGRALIAIMENYQRADGTVAVPPVLVPFLGKETIGG